VYIYIYFLILQKADLLSINNKIIHYCMDEQNKKYDNADVVDCLDVFILKEICEKRISRHKLFLYQTTMCATIPEIKISAYYTPTLRNNTLKVYMTIC